jgi:hypothetical protein
MEDWIYLTPKDLDVYLMAEQVTLLQTVVLGTGEKNPLPFIICDVVRRIRRDISSGRHPLSDDEFRIPAELNGVACALVLEVLQGRIPMLKLSPDQQHAADDARNQLARIAAGEIGVSFPLHISRKDPYGRNLSILCVHRRTPRVDTKSLEGL